MQSAVMVQVVLEEVRASREEVRSLQAQAAKTGAQAVKAEDLTWAWLEDMASVMELFAAGEFHEQGCTRARLLSNCLS